MTAIQTRALAPRQPCACPSHWASLCPGGKCLLANFPSRFTERVGQWRREGEGGPVPPASLPSPAGQGLFLLWVGCYVTDTGGSQAAKHRSTVAYTIALQTVTNNFHYPSQIESSAWPSCFNTSHTYRTQGFTLCPFCCDKTGLRFAPGPGMWDKALPLIPSLSQISCTVIKTVRRNREDTSTYAVWGSLRSGVRHYSASV